MIRLKTTRRRALVWEDELWWLNFMDNFQQTHALSDRYHSKLRLALKEWGATLTVGDEDYDYVLEFENDEDATWFLLRWQ